MHPKREAARNLRAQGCSVKEIAQKLAISRASASVWVRDIVLTPEQIAYLKQRQGRIEGQHTGARANEQKFREQRRRYQEAGRQKAREQRPLHLMGCMLYWAEGSKHKNSTYFVNADPHMMRLFGRFLREELDVTPDEMSIHVHCHTTDPDEIHRMETYWLELLDLPREALRKTIYKQGSTTRHTSLMNGLCGLRVNRTEITQHIFGAIQEYGGFEHPDWLA